MLSFGVVWGYGVRKAANHSWYVMESGMGTRGIFAPERKLTVPVLSTKTFNLSWWVPRGLALRCGLVRSPKSPLRMLGVGHGIPCRLPGFVGLYVFFIARKRDIKIAIFDGIEQGIDIVFFVFFEV